MTNFFWGSGKIRNQCGLPASEPELPREDLLPIHVLRRIKGPRQLQVNTHIAPPIRSEAFFGYTRFGKKQRDWGQLGCSDVAEVEPHSPVLAEKIRRSRTWDFEVNWHATSP
jgi:hypothetical protein